MAGTHVTFTVEDRAALDMLARQAQPPGSDVMNRLGEYLERSTRQRFKTQTAPDGTPWAPLKASYAKRKKYNKDKVLTLRGYLSGAQSMGAGPRYQTIDDTTVEVGVREKYGAIHQFGGEIDKPERQATVRYRSVAGKTLFAGKKHKKVTQRAVTIPVHFVKIPARPFLGISTADDQEIRAIIQDWVVERSK